MSLPYAPTVHETSPGGGARFALGRPGRRTLWFVGLNPSTADAEAPDPTLRKVLGFAERAGFDGWMVLNLYPQRTPYPDALHRRPHGPWRAANRAAWAAWFARMGEGDRAWAAWGAGIEARPWLAAERDALLALHGDWHAAGPPTRHGHPRHPARLAYGSAWRRWTPPG